MLLYFISTGLQFTVGKNLVSDIPIDIEQSEIAAVWINISSGAVQHLFSSWGLNSLKATLVTILKKDLNKPCYSGEKIDTLKSD